MWKFRSMYSDADKRLDEIKAKYGNEMEGPIFKLTNDPRIFPFGHFIRKYSIDELPQLINVLTGDMSIVGPRPLPTYETAEFPEIAQRRRMSVKPGLTCYWQIEDRSDNKDFGSLIAKDLKYIDNWRLRLDLLLILRTIPVAIFGKGAK
jgi:lipopolysaccharide/colanic/teichoic acid biosynthesis glycosyltransferase